MSAVDNSPPTAIPAPLVSDDAERRRIFYDVPPTGDRHPAAVYLARLGPGSRDATRRRLGIAAGLLANATARELRWEALRYQHLAALQAKLAGTCSPAYANAIIAAVRGVLREAWRLELIPAEQYHRARDVARVAGESLPAGRLVSPAELARLLDSCARDRSLGHRGAYDAALIACLYAGGLRREELRRLNLGDYDPAAGTLRVRGKGAREGLAFLSAGAREAVEQWCAILAASGGAGAGTPMFPRVGATRVDAGKVYPDVAQRPRVEHLWGRLARRCRAAGVRPFTPHDLRRSCISQLLENGADLAIVQRLARHRQAQTTVRYDRRGDDAKQRAAELLPFPYRRAL